VWSIDDAPEWLEETRAYLLRQGLPTEHVMAWDDVLRLRAPAAFDLALHDLGGMPLRQTVLEDVLALCRVRGFLVLDDAHNGPTAPTLLRRLGSTTSASGESPLTHSAAMPGSFTNPESPLPRLEPACAVSLAQSRTPMCASAAASSPRGL
jgi:hypothetical protein